MALICLSTARQVIEALDGIAAVCELTGRLPKAVSAWQTAYGRFPPDTFVVMILALFAKGFTAPASLWGQVNAEGITLVPARAEATQSV